MMSHNICLKGEIWKIILKYSFYPFLSGAFIVPLITLAKYCFIHGLKCIGTPHFSIIFTKGNNFSDFLFASLQGKMGSTLIGKNLLLQEHSLCLKTGPQMRIDSISGEATLPLSWLSLSNIGNHENGRVAPPENVPMHCKQNTAILQWLEHLCDHENVFLTAVVHSARSGDIIKISFRFSFT